MKIVRTHQDSGGSITSLTTGTVFDDDAELSIAVQSQDLNSVVVMYLDRDRVIALRDELTRVLGVPINLTKISYTITRS